MSGELVRGMLFRATEPISNPSLQGAVFAVALIIADHVFNVAHLLKRAFGATS